MKFAAGPFEAVILSIPFYFLWNFFAPIYLPQVQAPYNQIPFWHCVGLFLLVWIARSMLIPFVGSPNIVKIGKKW